MTGEPKPPEEPLYQPGEEAVVRMWLFDEAARKAEEIRATLIKLLGEIESSNLRRDNLRIKISLDPTLRIVVFPKVPIKIHHEDIDVVELSREAQILERISVPVQIPPEGHFELSMVGRVVKSRELSAEFNPLDPNHDILVFEEGIPPGLKHEGGVRLNSYVEKDTSVQVVDYQIH